MIGIKILDSRVKSLPTYSTTGSAGLDLRVLLDEPTTIQPRETILLHTGIAVHIKDPNLAGLILPRSGLGNKGLVLSNTIGLIDSDYQGEILLSCYNRSVDTLYIHPQDRIAQLIIIPVIQAQFKIIDEFEPTSRGNGGFGSTGIGE